MTGRPRQSPPDSSEAQSSASPPPAANRSTVSALLGRASGSGQLPSAHNGNRDIGANVTLMSFANNQERPAIPMPVHRQTTRTRRSALVVDGSNRRRGVGHRNGTNSILAREANLRLSRANGIRRIRSSHNNHNGYNTRSAHAIHTDPTDPNLYRSYLHDIIHRSDNSRSNRPDSPIKNSELDSEELSDQALSQYIYTRPNFHELNVDLSIEVAAVNRCLREADESPEARLKAFLEFFAEEVVRGAATIRGPRHPHFPHQTHLHYMFDDLRRAFAETGRDLVDVASEYASLEELEGLRFFIELEMHAFGAARRYFITGSDDQSNAENQREASLAAESLQDAYLRSSNELRRIREIHREMILADAARREQAGSPGSSRARDTSSLLAFPPRSPHASSVQQTLPPSIPVFRPTPLPWPFSDDNEPGNILGTSSSSRPNGSG
ncbi:hypothetical protein F503_00020 [Ophiostoma piceae UAMH 11346]|uniref:Uncharacterized protein n=1 Tax=Ophiostoma piceae (strain UAMH 11346) TaxID=1262450 RepID=S3BZI2_OPHP1|nr:hypothetical protein F503_00020 [Ophiostoma piceae UAMH 11346]